MVASISVLRVSDVCFNPYRAAPPKQDFVPWGGEAKIKISRCGRQVSYRRIGHEGGEFCTAMRGAERAPVRLRANRVWIRLELISVTGRLT